MEFSDDSYVLTNPISEANIREMRNNMDETDVVKFDAFLERVWGIKPPKQSDYEYVEEELGSEPKKETVETVAPVAPENKLSKEKQMELERKKLEQAKLQRQLKMQKMQEQMKKEAMEKNNTQNNDTKEMNMRRQAAEAARRATQSGNETKISPKPIAGGVSSILNGVNLENPDQNDENK